jgi:hypothetical protein
MTTEIARLEDVRPGDLFFTGMSGAPAKALVYAGQLMLGEFVAVGGFVVGHVGVVTKAADTTAPRMVEAMPSGARERDLTLDRDWTRKTAFVRLPEAWPGQAEDAAAIARLMIGTPYSFGSYAQLAAWRFGWKTWALEERINRRRPERIRLPHWSNGPAEGSAVKRGGHLPTEAICSVLADQAWTLAGARVVHGTKPQIVTPGLLASQLMHRPGVVWGGAGILG